ncbi:hypothetical protein E2B89_13565 [Salmonella enterica]|uniref:Uncharacterized protein n=3 Tax=Salmonella enterica TaxID=28901 RepID=A0A2I5HGN2_SALDZ|nr:hypothetical protein LFZ53_12725 [Salmonella enterica subsp. diarizonae serovar 50:k:z str. MZ0080]ATW54719.1 hypothetical protein CNQ75_09440 [Salmonella enterica subsp. diarizonae]AXC65156.1 hypothetical protein DOE63_05725 [Salmonella enterica subsp. diarizonae serovar 59:z10:-]AXD72079.1 hypothetical protein CHC34_14680 [Salmonella enterica]EAT5046870.1 hypothetical protein [Salmonella enterica subsp. enterica]EBE3720588.1 hypothetical protein [Salmonella enterica subsp. diarizonae sero
MSPKEVSELNCKKDNPDLNGQIKVIIYLRDILIFYNNTGFFMATVLSPSSPHVSRFLTDSGC